MAIPQTRRDSILRAVAATARDLLQARDWRSVLPSVLCRLGKAVDVDRVYVFENRRRRDDTLAVAQVAEWVADGIPPAPPQVQTDELGYEEMGFTRWRQVLPSGEPIAATVADLPAAERDLLLAQQIQSLAVVPIFDDDRWWGFIGFDDCRRPRRWGDAEVEALRTAASTLGAAIHRSLAEAALRASEERLRHAQKLESLGRLAGGVAHDFNNMLTVIGGYTDLLAGGLPEESPHRADLEEIRRATGEATRLARQLLTFSRRQPAEPRPVDMPLVVRTAERMLRLLVGERVEMVLDLAVGVPRVWIDPGQVEQVLLNLAVNARDAMPGGGRLTIRVASRDLAAHARPGLRGGTYVELLVSDTGTGIPPEIVEKIFDPFFTTKEAGVGTGLGLATVYGIVTQAGGWIGVESRPGSGTAFRVLLPGGDRPAAP